MLGSITEKKLLLIIVLVTNLLKSEYQKYDIEILMYR